jgi:hypothetical protein
MVECQAVNAVAPFILNSRLKPLMAMTPGVRVSLILAGRAR